MSVSLPVKEDIIQEQILGAAKRLFAVHGLSKVTMDDVAKAIGKGRSSLYYYYKSKDEIFDAVMDIEIREMMAAISRAVEEAQTTEEKLQAFCSAKLQVLGEKRSFFKTLDIGMDADAFSQFKKTQVIHHNQIMRQESDLLKQLLAVGMERGELRNISEKEQDILIFVLLSSLHGMKREMIMENNFEKIQPAVNAFTDMVMHGLKH
jgi:AcrR family transcriptional regulator